MHVSRPRPQLWRAVEMSRSVRGSMSDRCPACRKSKSKRGSLGCWTSAIEADVYRTGELVSKRMDVLISRDFSVSKGTRLAAEPLSTLLTTGAVRQLHSNRKILSLWSSCEESGGVWKGGT